MNIALIGTGRMAVAIEMLAVPDHRIVARFNSSNPFESDSFEGAELPDVAIDFSVPEAIAGHADTCCHLGIPLVVGTTGWQRERATVERLVLERGGTLLHASNFSIGIALVRQMLQAALPSLNRLDDFDVMIHDVHHAEKVDSPSGTALSLAEMLLHGLDAKTCIDTPVNHCSDRPNAIAVTSERVGRVFGRHSVGFDSAFDAITITHEAKSRDGFAAGAIRAAEWLVGRRGVFTFDDVFASPFSARRELSGSDDISHMHSNGV